MYVPDAMSHSSVVSSSHHVPLPPNSKSANIIPSTVPSPSMSVYLPTCDLVLVTRASPFGPLVGTLPLAKVLSKLFLNLSIALE